MAKQLDMNCEVMGSAETAQMHLPTSADRHLKKRLHPVSEYQRPAKGRPGSQPTSEQGEGVYRLKPSIHFSDFDTIREYIKISPSSNTKYWHQEVASNANRHLTSSVRLQAAVPTA